MEISTEFDVSIMEISMEFVFPLWKLVRNLMFPLWKFHWIVYSHCGNSTECDVSIMEISFPIVEISTEFDVSINGNFIIMCNPVVFPLWKFHGK